MRTTTRILPALTVVAATALAVAVPGTAEAKTRTTVDLSGYSEPAAPVDGAVGFAGLTTGDPFYGDAFTGAFGAGDGVLPSAQDCEPGTGTLTLGDVATGTVTLAVAGEICEHWGTYRSFGSWTVADGTGQYAKAKGSGFFSFSAQSWGTIWSASGELKA